ncbi:PBP1A family penicillin-binding protein [Prochlorococcus sp. MIT 1223]|uniref:transglycosylase domain-containing protein n=1 Tax=Prochlorococcus sp. MIT 1223 TaxID=3096217 RepID=UPI002A75521F|nr:PBP1A family penicillin-binding protein [Prochlorococcus sp. MIT 1223]
MINGFLRWFLIASSSIILGSVVAISEKSIIQRIDATLAEAKKVLTFSRPGTITLLSTNGIVIQKLGHVTREKINFENIPIKIKNAFIASEDRRFYKHNGVDFWSISRAIKTNLNQRAVHEGGSTITQQLARIVFLKQDQSIKRKIKEAALAFKLERQLTKDEILEEYLNKVYLGSGAYGIADASWIYFSKTPDQLDTDEIALIAGLAPAPSLFSPLVSPQLAIKRRDIVLERMRLEGFISQNEFKSALNSPLQLSPSTPKYFNSLAPYFSGWVLQELPFLISKDQLEIGGLTIHTSLNLDWQQKAKEVVKKQAKGELEGAIVSIEPSTGLVRVLIGGKDFESNEFNRATQALRSPGSTFKIITYAAALNKGYKPNDIVEDEPKCWDDYCPKNFDNEYLGEVSLSDSFKYSLNTVAVYLLDQVGFDEVISIANKLGIGKESRLEKYYPLAIGVFEETVINMTAAYAAIANRGIYMKPTPFEKIIGPEGTIIWERDKNGSEGRIAVSYHIAETLTKMLTKVVNEGTGRPAIIKDIDVAGKTGTSEGARDVWFIGSLPKLTTGVWFGHDNNQETNNSSGKAAYAWRTLMRSIMLNDSMRNPAIREDFN